MKKSTKKICVRSTAIQPNISLKFLLPCIVFVILLTFSAYSMESTYYKNYVHFLFNVKPILLHSCSLRVLQNSNIGAFIQSFCISRYIILLVFSLKASFFNIQSIVFKMSSLLDLRKRTIPHVLVCLFFLVNLVDYGLLVFEFTLGETSSCSSLSSPQVRLHPARL